MYPHINAPGHPAHPSTPSTWTDDVWISMLMLVWISIGSELTGSVEVVIMQELLQEQRQRRQHGKHRHQLPH